MQNISATQYLATGGSIDTDIEYLVKRFTVKTTLIEG
jgi:hypothetical protein